MTCSSWTRALPVFCCLVSLVNCENNIFNLKHAGSIYQLAHDRYYRSEAPTPPLFYTDALLDHSRGPPVKWDQQFFVIQDYWRAGGPVFVLVNAETPAGPPSDYWYMHELGRQHGALLISIEHRFYGLSQPFNTTSVENLRYLTSEQALGDLARFVSFLKRAGTEPGHTSRALTLRHSCADSKFVLFGGSYGGNLVAWFKIKYPQLVVGVVASSAPVLIQSNFQQYASSTGLALENEAIGGSLACSAAVKTAVTEAHSLATLSMANPLDTVFPGALAPCTAITTSNDLAVWESLIYGYFETMALYNNAANKQIENSCDTMLDAASPLAGLEALVATWVTCIPANFEGSLPLDTQSDAGLVRPFTWQTCNEFGWFQTTDGPDTPFSAFQELNLQYYYDTCLAAYEGAFEGTSFPYITESLNAYGGRNLQGTNTTLANGNVDPWSTLGIVNETDPFYNSCVGPSNCDAMFVEQKLATGNTVVNIANSCHCEDMYQFSSTNPATPSLVWGQARIAEEVDAYLAVAPEPTYPLACCVPSVDNLCTSAAIVECVGAFDPFCFDSWDAQCIEEAADRCGLKCDGCSRAR